MRFNGFVQFEFFIYLFLFIYLQFLWPEIVAACILYHQRTDLEQIVCLEYIPKLVLAAELSPKIIIQLAELTELRQNQLERPIENQ